ncbi:MAG TPA: mannose-1-phosphate guanylyltransferase/mannose-6-phosphate isomerase [Stellaceae bacterium]|jgi:mannose-1-phosphate guanylyltransferase/mannose-6-phosphate isomerase|nr:mannose-1-phosphate guanylyltransferase/mannose-6-phosphate isomerase [Stellaceae bacterium]
MARSLIHPVVLSGGSGTRLWPLSRALSPKQLLPLISDKSLLQETVLRVNDARQFAAPLVIANDEHRFLVGEQLRAIGARPRALVLEPQGRNTAPAICVAALILSADDPDALLLVLPSDHAIKHRAAFLAGVERAVAAARAGALVTFGVAPDRTETSYGYIRRGKPWPEIDGCFAVVEFVEKPDATRAAKMVAAGDYYWNSGMFVLPAKVYLQELARRDNAMIESCRRALSEAKRDLDFLRLEATAFTAARSISIDYAVMEHTKAAAVVAVDIGWSDVGSFDALWQAGSKDADGNVAVGNAVTVDTRNSYLRAEHGLVTTLGVEDLIVVATADAVLVVPRARASDLKQLVAKLEREGRSELQTHPLVERPWGSYRSIHNGERVQVKHIVVKPGGRLSLQYHHKRAEHWVVVRGTARVTRGEEVTMLGEDQSTYIPIGMPHRLENPGDTPVHLIEVQTGSYLGEDDIVRLEDTYGRVAKG